MARFTQSQAFRPSNTDDGSAARSSSAAKAFQSFGSRFTQMHADKRVADAKKDAQQADFKNPELKDNNTMYGDTFDAAVLKGHLATVQSYVSNRIAELATEHQEDPVTFAATSKELIKESLKGVNENVRGTAGIYFNNQAESQLSKLTQNAMEKARQEASVAQAEAHNDGLEVVLRGIANKEPPEVTAQNFQVFKAGVDADTSLTETERSNALEKAAQGMVEQTHFTDMDGMSAERAFKYLDSINDYVPNTHSPDEWESFVSKARTRILRQKSIEDGSKVQSTARHTAQVKNVLTALGNGYPVDDKTYRAIYGQSDDKQRKLLNDALDVSQFQTKPYSEQLDEINSLSQGKNLDNAAKFGKMKQALAVRRAAASKDLMGTAQAQGITAFTSLPTDAEEVEQRHLEVERLNRFYGIRDGEFFSKAEASFLEESLGEASSVQLGQFVAQYVNRPEALIQLSKSNPSLVVAAQKENPTVQREILLGQARLNEKIAVMPTKLEYMSIWHDKAAGAYINPEDERITLNGALAHYASKEIEVFDANEFEKSIDAVSNGFIEHNGGRIELPEGVDGNVMSDYMENVTPDKIASLGGVLGRTDESAARAARNGVWRSVGKNRYSIVHNLQVLKKKNGENFVIDYDPTVRSAGGYPAYDPSGTQSYADYVKNKLDYESKR